MQFNLIERYYLRKIDPKRIPSHIAIVMDGNGRWGLKHAQSRSEGHKKGAEVFENIADFCQQIGVSHLTVYAFSTENWKRPPEEVETIMKLLQYYLDKTRKNKDKYNVILHFIGRTDGLSEHLLQQMQEAEQLTAKNTGIIVNVALNYGGRDEIVRAVKKAMEEGSPEEMTQARFSALLDTGDQPDPELILKPGGEYRLSNFLLWQSAYSEFWFSKVLWPQFRPRHLLKAILAFQHRKRRFGGVKNV